MAKEKEHTWCSVSCSGSVWSWASSLGRTVWHCTNKNRFNLFKHCTNQKQVQPVQQIEIVCVINTGIIRPLMIALQVSHSLQIPWTMSRSLVKINVNQFFTSDRPGPLIFLLPSSIFGSLSCSLLDVPVMQLPHRNQTLPRQVELVLVWRWLPKIEMVCVINRWRVKPRLRQTANAILYRVTNFSLLLFSSAVYYFFMEIIFFSGYVHRSVFFEQFYLFIP